MKKDIAAQEAFHKLSSVEVITESTVKAIEKFVCAMYGKKKLKSINDARLQIFLDKYKPWKDEADNKCKENACALPPCQSVLLEKIKRTHFIAARWLTSTERDLPDLSETNFGWLLEENTYHVQWFQGDAAPKSIDLLQPEEENSEGENDENEEDDR